MFGRNTLENERLLSLEKSYSDLRNLFYGLVGDLAEIREQQDEIMETIDELKCGMSLHNDQMASMWNVLSNKLDTKFFTKGNGTAVNTAMFLSDLALHLGATLDLESGDYVFNGW